MLSSLDIGAGVLEKFQEGGVYENGMDSDEEEALHDENRFLRREIKRLSRV